jgi:gephyrin
MVITATDAPKTYKVTTRNKPSPLPADTIYRINTGAPLPLGTDSVIMVEDTRLVSSHSDGEEHEVETLAQVTIAENVRAIGSDVRRGELVMRKGEIISAKGGEIGTLVFVGRTEVHLNPSILERAS